MTEAAETANLGIANPRQIRRFTIKAMQAGLVPFIQSSPGCGKSSIVRSIAKDYGLQLIDMRLSTAAQEDLTGLPEFYTNEHGKRRARFAVFDEYFPLKSDVPPPGKNGWLLFLDEFNSASEAVQAASYKLILDRMVGLEHLHDDVAIVCAGNQDTDRAITTHLSTAMQSRLVNLTMGVDFNCWLEDVAIPESYDHRIIAYLSQYNTRLMDFRPDHNDKTFCCPRTWEFMNRLIHGEEYQIQKDLDGTVKHFEMREYLPLFAGTITSGTAIDFVQFCQVVNNIIKVSQILADPDNCPVPNDNMLQWATIAAMIDKIDDKTFGPMTVYADRFAINFRILFYRAAFVKKPALRRHPAYAKSALLIGKYLGGGE
jgi:hypothetical protein